MDEEGNFSEGDDLHHEWNVRQDRFFNDGYREGLSLGRDSRLQDGFEYGFVLGAEEGKAIGVLTGLVLALADKIHHLPPEVHETIKALQSKSMALREKGKMLRSRTYAVDELGGASDVTVRDNAVRMEEDAAYMVSIYASIKEAMEGVMGTLGMAEVMLQVPSLRNWNNWHISQSEATAVLSTLGPRREVESIKIGGCG